MPFNSLANLRVHQVLPAGFSFHLSCPLTILMLARGSVTFPMGSIVQRRVATASNLQMRGLEDIFASASHNKVRYFKV
jgi:hypothetical protein